MPYSNSSFTVFLTLFLRTSHLVKGEKMNRVRDFRIEKGLSQLDLARAIGVARQTINMIENDKYNPTLELCINLAKALETDLNNLFWDSSP